MHTPGANIFLEQCNEWLCLRYKFVILNRLFVRQGGYINLKFIMVYDDCHVERIKQNAFEN